MNKYDQRIREITSKFIGSIEPQQPVDISDAELGAAEREIGHRLPDDYREFLRNYGGFFVATGIYDPASTISLCEISTFFGVNSTRHAIDLVKQYSDLRDLTPPDLLRIGFAEGGFPALALTGEHQGKICFVDWDTSSPTWDGIRVVADSFDEFMNLLEPPTAV